MSLPPPPLLPHATFLPPPSPAARLVVSRSETSRMSTNEHRASRYLQSDIPGIRLTTIWERRFVHSPLPNHFGVSRRRVRTLPARAEIAWRTIPATCECPRKTAPTENYRKGSRVPFSTPKLRFPRRLLGLARRRRPYSLHTLVGRHHRLPTMRTATTWNEFQHQGHET